MRFRNHELLNLKLIISFETTDDFFNDFKRQKNVDYNLLNYDGGS